MKFKFPERKHKVAIIGAGRFGSRIFRNLVETHRDTIKQLAIWDGATVGILIFSPLELKSVNLRLNF